MPLTQVQPGMLGTPQPYNFKNRFINGNMTISQRYGSSSVTPASGVTYTLDRWHINAAQSSKLSVQQNAGSVTPPVGFTYYAGMTSLSSYTVLAGDYTTLRQSIEGYNVADLGWGTANAKTITLSFWVRSSLTGTFGGTLNNADYSRSYPYSYTISAANTWEYKTITIAGDTSGTWLTDNSIGISVGFQLGTGSTYTGPAGSWSSALYLGTTGTTNIIATNGATLYITGCQLEVGVSATTFDYRSIGTELQLCQRYYEKSYNPDVVPGTNTGDGRIFTFAVYVNASVLDYGGSIWFKVNKRTNPTIAYWTETGTSGTWDSRTSGSSGTLTPVSNRVGTSSFCIYCTGSGFTNVTYSVSGHWTASAEL
jgi:hypothetical protein